MAVFCMQAVIALSGSSEQSDAARWSPQQNWYRTISSQPQVIRFSQLKRTNYGWKGLWLLLIILRSRAPHFSHGVKWKAERKPEGGAEKCVKFSWIIYHFKRLLVEWVWTKWNELLIHWTKCRSYGALLTSESFTLCFQMIVQIALP